MNSKNSDTIINNYLADISATLTRLPVGAIAQVIDMLEEARERGRSVFLFGNGGSAATASHFASDLAKGAICSGKPRLRAFALTDHVPLLSAWANDSAYEHIFAEQLENFIEAGDIAIGISGSGNSANVLNGVKAAKAKGATTIGFISFDGGRLKELVDIPVVVPIHNMEQAEDMHLLLGHVITTCLREASG
jgi:D-sedoheptulose 7-phosphate isomerase